MWTTYREGGVEAALPLLHPDVEFVAVDGSLHAGHAGVRAFFQAFEDQGELFEASPYSFEGHDGAVLVAGYRRIHSTDGTRGMYMYFVHVVRDGLIVRLSAHSGREDATAALRAAHQQDRPGEAPSR